MVTAACERAVVRSKGTTGTGGEERSLFHQEKGARIEPLLSALGEVRNDDVQHRRQLSSRRPVFRCPWPGPLLYGNLRKSLYPIVTIVLYFGYEKEWKQKLTLKECLDIPEELQPYVNDYRINLFQIAFLEPEQAALFQSDFRVVADYFVQMRKNHDLIYKQVGEEDTIMFDALREIMAEDFQKAETRGIEQGVGIGEYRAKKETAVELSEMGLSVEKIAKAVKVSVQQVQEWLSESLVTA